MARKASSRKPALTLPKPSARSPNGRAKSSRPVSASQAAEASQQGLLQLTFARHAHGYGFVGAAAFLLDAILILYIGIQSPVLPTGVRSDFLVWLLPSVAGAVASWDAVRLKREPYRRHYESTHFAMSTVGMVLFFVIALAVVLMIWHQFPSWLDPGWIYPIAVAGVPLTIISMGMTWQGLGLRKAGSFVLAAITPILALFLPFGHISLSSSAGQTLYVVTLLIGAIATEFAGSLLHIIASSTSVYQREILKADNSKVALIQQDYQQKREALDYKERALRGREAHLEALQQELEDQAKELKTKFSDVTARENAIEKGTRDLRDIDRKVASARAEIEARAEEIRLRDADISTLKTEHEKMRQTLNAREASLAEREKEVKRTSIELTSQLRSSETKVKSVEEREARLQELEKSFQGQRRMFDDRESEYVSREKKISDQEAALRERSAEIERQASAVEEAQHQLDDKTKKYAELFKDAKMKEAAAGSNEADTRRQKENLDSREKKLHEMQTNLQAEIKRLNEENRNLLEKAKEIEERESDLQLKSLELENKTREGRAPGMRDMGREGQLEEWERRLREREEDLKRRTYQKEKEMEMREGAVKARITTPAGEAEAEEAIAVEKKADRVKTGTPRLDDLLYGGIPFNSNVLFVGPAFVGKEIALLNFIAEGLKKGIPVIIITTTKLPIDIARDIAPILPTFVEYDQLGLVRWIDCTSPVSGKPVKEKNAWRVNGPTDFDSIYQLVGQLDEEVQTHDWVPYKFTNKALMIGSFQLERIR